MYEIVYYKTSNGEVPFQVFIKKLEVKTEIKINKQILLLSHEGHRQRRPHVDFLDKGIYELRVRISSNQYRILYFFFKKDSIIITHGFIKKSNKRLKRRYDIN